MASAAGLGALCGSRSFKNRLKGWDLLAVQGRTRPMSSIGVRPQPSESVLLASDAFDVAPMPQTLSAQGWNLNGDSPLYDSQVRESAWAVCVFVVHCGLSFTRG